MKASIKDFSLKGICLETSDDISTVKVGDKLTLEVTPIARTDSARFVIRKLFRDNDYEFTVKDIRMGRPTTIRLHTAKTEKIVS